MFRTLLTPPRAALLTRTLSNALKPGGSSHMANKPPAFYVVSQGYKPGIYRDYKLAQEQIVGYQNGFYKKFGTYDEAYNYFFNTRHTDTGFKRSAESSSFDIAFQSAVEKEKRLKSNVDIEDVVSTFCNMEKTAVVQEEEAPVRSKRPRKEVTHTDDLEDLAEFQNYLLSSMEEKEEEAGKVPGPRKRRYYGGGNKKKDRRDDTGASTTKEGVPIVYVDGCCLGRVKAAANRAGAADNRAGAAANRAGVGVFWGPGDRRNIAERLWGAQTNQRAELWAAVRAIQSALQGGYQAVEIHTDSQYVVGAMTEWVGAWKKRGWKRTHGNQPIKNKDLMVLLDSLVCYIDVTWVKVKGHSNLPGNEMADQLAKCGAHLSERARPSLKPGTAEDQD